MSPHRAAARGLTLLEILVSISILAMMALLIYGAFNTVSRGKAAEAQRTSRTHQGRDATLRIARELQAAFLSLHNPQNPALITRTTAFIGVNGASFDRVDFAAFAHRRFERDAKESDQCELGFFASRDPDNPDKMDLVRREQTPIDAEPKRGGVVNAIAEDIELFDLKYLDPLSGLWIESWDSSSVSGQPGRLPLEVRIQLIMKGVPPNGTSFNFITKTFLPIQQPLSFGIPR